LSNFEKLPPNELYSKKISNGPFMSPIATRSKPMFVQEQESTRAFSPTYAKTTIFEDGQRRQKTTIKSGYKNASNINLGSVNAEIEPVKKRHFQKDRDLYNSDIFNGELNSRKKIVDSKYNTLNLDDQIQDPRKNQPWASKDRGIPNYKKYPKRMFSP
jgi:hypothetical protein